MNIEPNHAASLLSADVIAVYDRATDEYVVHEASGEATSQVRKLHVILPQCFVADSGGLVECSIERMPQAELRMHWPGATMSIVFEGVDEARRFERRYLPILIDVGVACESESVGEGILWLAAENSQFWLLSASREGADWKGQAVLRDNLDWLDIGAAGKRVRELLTKVSASNACEVMEMLCQKDGGLALPEGLPLLAPLDMSLPGKRPRLTAKVGRGCEWFLIVPLEFHSVANGGRSAAWDAEWIATAKSFTRNCRERSQIEVELSDLEIFLRHTVVIFNTYADFKDPRLLIATEQVKALLSHLQCVDVQVDDRIESLSLRVFCNPSEVEVEAVLRDPQTWYVFADFHTNAGKWWELGDGQGAFDLDRFGAGSLQHVRLLRVYHCHSLFGQSGAMTLASSIVGALLRAGAMRVEGSPFREPYSPFLRQLVRLISHENGLRPVLFCSCLAAGEDLDSLLRKLAVTLGHDSFTFGGAPCSGTA